MNDLKFLRIEMNFAFAEILILVTMLFAMKIAKYFSEF